MAKRENHETDEDPVNRTFRLYGPVIKKAYKELREENPNFGRYETSPEHVVEAKVGDEGVTGISFKDTKMLEGKVIELTGDSKAKLMRNPQEYLRLLRLRKSYIATAILGILGGIFFLSSNITGNAIANVSQSSGNILGAVLLVVGLVAGFFWVKKK